MKQQVMLRPGVIEIREVPVPEVQPHEVLVKIINIGICGSDIHVYHGTHPFTDYPVTQGHEVSGGDFVLGRDVSTLHVGQKVTIEPQLTCGQCYPCRHGRYNLCEKLRVMGFQAPGTAQQFFAADAVKITPLPDTMSYREGALIEPLAVAVHAVERLGDVSGENICVIGAGPIGNLVAQTAKGVGARQVMITDVNDFRLDLARRLGIDHAVNTAKTDFGEALAGAFGPDKADAILDCAGNDTTINQAIRHARKGTPILLVAVFTGMAKADLALLNDHELDLLTSMMYRHEHYLEAIRLASEGRVQLEPLVSTVFPIAEYQAAYQYIEEHRDTSMKVLIDIQAQAVPFPVVRS